MPKQTLQLLDTESGNVYSLETSSDILASNFTVILPEKDGSLAMKSDINEAVDSIKNGDVIVNEAKKIGSFTADNIAKNDLSNVTLSIDIINSLRGYTGSQGIQGNTGATGATGPQGATGAIGYTGSVGQGFVISQIFNSLSELTSGNIPDSTFGLVAGTLSPSDVDYGKLYLRKNNTWQYITDLSVQGAQGIQGPQGNVGYTCSIGAQGITGYNGSTGFTGSQGIQGYTGSAGSSGNQGPVGYTGSKGDTGPMGPQGPAGTSSSSNNNAVTLNRWPIDLTKGNYFSGYAMMLSVSTPYVVNANPYGQVTSFILEIKDGGNYTINWSGIGNVTWPSRSAPTLSASGIDLLAFISTDGGDNWKGLVLGKDIG